MPALRSDADLDDRLKSPAVNLHRQPRLVIHAQLVERRGVPAVLLAKGSLCVLDVVQQVLCRAGVVGPELNRRGVGRSDNGG